MLNARLLVDGELKRVDDELINVDVKGDEALRAGINNLLCSNSKRIRSILTILFLKANSVNKISDNTINIVTAGEIIHNASLLHDDVLDNAKLRRGKLAFCEEFTPHLSILTGDYLLSVATERLLNCRCEEILKIFLNSTKEMCMAEIRQFFLRGKNTTLNEYIEICAGKTASLFEAIMECSAIVENLDRNLFKRVAHNFGIFFQLKNDLEEISRLADKENKILTPKDFLGIEKTLDLIDNYFEQIRRDIDNLPDSIYKKGLEDLLESL